MHYELNLTFIYIKAVGVIVIDAATQKVLLLSSRKREGAYVLPRGDCNANPDEHPEKAALRILQETAGASATFLTNRVGSYAEANKKGKVVAHHWMYEVHSPVFQNTWPESERQRVWVTYNEALAATKNKRMSHLALQKCSLAKTIV
jgi:ADP-ribose pyrophosphatase YjhB (NUDIX family)